MTGRRARLLSRRRAMCVGVVAALWVSTVSGQAVRREAVTIETAPSATRLLESTLDLAAAGDWDRATESLEELATREPAALVSVDSRRVLRAELAALVLWTQWPAEAGADHRTRVDLTAQAWLDQGRLFGQRGLLRRLLEQAPEATAAPLAANELAELSWRMGELDTAATIWQRLTPASEATALDPAAPLRIRTAELSAADLDARQVLIAIVGHDRRRAEQLLRLFEQQHGTTSSRLAGAEQPLLAALRHAAAVEFNHGDSAPSPWSLWRGDRPLVNRLLWQRALPAESRPHRLTSTPPLFQSHLSAILPVVDDGRLLWQSSQAIHAVDGEGQALWAANGGQVDSTLFRFADQDEPRYELPYVGTLLPTVAVDRDRLFAVVGAPFSSVSSREPRDVLQRLVCLDLGLGEGKLRWSRPSEEVLPSAEWRFSGPPVAAGGRVYVAARQSRPGAALGVCALDSDDGELQWFQPVVGLLQESPTAHHVVTSDRLTLVDSRLIVAGDFGAIAALDAAAGRMDWIRRDEPLVWTPPPLVPVGEVPGRAALAHHGRLYVVEHDDRSVLCLDAATGAELWRTTIATPLLQVVGVRGGTLVLAGNQLWGLDADMGDLRWQFGADDPEGRIVGRAVFAQDSVLACSRDELWQVDTLTGQPLDRVPLSAAYGLTGGHVVCGPDRIVLASPTSLSTWSIHPALSNDRR